MADVNSLQKQQEELVKKQFATAQQQLQSQRGRTQRQSNLGFDRFAAVTGRTGGAVQKARSGAQQDIGRQFGELGAGLKAQEAGALQAAKEGQIQRGFAREERLGSQQFATGERLGSQQFNQNQFDRQLNETARQFNMEFSENQRTNLVNSLALLEDTGLDGMKQFNDFLKVFGQFFGGIKSLPAPAIGQGTPQDEAINVINSQHLNSQRR